MIYKYDCCDNIELNEPLLIIMREIDCEPIKAILKLNMVLDIAHIIIGSDAMIEQLICMS